MKKICLILLASFLLIGCGGVSQEEYDKAVAENEALEKEIENLKYRNEIDLITQRTIDYIDKEYECLVTICYIFDTFQPDSMMETKNSIEELYEEATTTIQTSYDLTISMIEVTVTDEENELLSESLNEISSGLLDTHKKLCDDVYSEWCKLSRPIIDSFTNE